MATYIAVAITGWLCVLVATPRKPLPHNEVQELVYARLLGRHQRLTMLVVGMTIVMAIGLVIGHAPVGLPRTNDVSGSPAVTDAHQLAVVPTCTGLDDSGEVPTCYTPQAGGTWLVEQKDWEGTWQPVGMVTTLPTRSG
jgi:hypothetical protein